MGTRESVFICFHCRRPILRWDNLRAKPVGFSPNVKREAGNWIVPCRHCGLLSSSVSEDDKRILASEIARCL